MYSVIMFVINNHGVWIEYPYFNKKEGGIIDFFQEVDLLTSVKAVTRKNINSVIGERVAFYCKDCQKQMFIDVPPDGDIFCSDCSFRPAISPKSKAVVLSQSARLKRVREFFTRNDIDEFLLRATEKYGEGINNMHSKNYSESERRAFYKRYSKLWKYLDKISSYILAGKCENENKSDIKTYTDAGLYRKQSDSKGKYSISFFGEFHNDINMKPADAVESTAYRKGLTEQFNDSSFLECEISDYATDPTDKQAIRLLSQGHTQTDTAKKLGLSRQNLRTRIKRVKNELSNTTARKKIKKSAKVPTKIA